MPLDGAALGRAIKAAVDAVEDGTDRDKLFEEMGKAIVNYIKANGVVAFAAKPVGPGLASAPGGGAVSGTLTVSLGTIT